jgi:hypothetical protein
MSRNSDRVVIIIKKKVFDQPVYKVECNDGLIGSALHEAAHASAYHAASTPPDRPASEIDEQMLVSSNGRTINNSMLKISRR